MHLPSRNHSCRNTSCCPALLLLKTNQSQLLHSDLMLQSSISPARTANQMALRTSHPADCQALSSHPAGSSPPPVSASHLLLLPNAENSAATSFEQQPSPWRGFFFAILQQVTEHDYREGRKQGITNPHMQARQEYILGLSKGEKN